MAAFSRDALAGKAALITGATSGIGAETARHFARAGAHVMLSGRNAERGRRVLDEIVNDGGTAAFEAGDVTSSSFCNRLVERTVERFGKLDILFNNAGIAEIGKVDTLSDEDWLRVMRTNLNGPFYMARAAVKEMKKQGAGGSIVNMSSECGFIGYENMAAYSATKGGMLLFTKALALELAPDKIRVNAICPGDILTDMTFTAWKTLNVSKEEVIANLNQHIPLGRVGQVSDIAQAVLFMSSDAAGFMTGAGVSVDGGTTAR